MITIYGVLRSRATRPVWLLDELGADYTLVPVVQAYRLADPQAPDAPLNTASPEFLAINPMGQVPALDHDGFCLSESMAITLYLARVLTGDPCPRDAREEGAAVQWAMLASCAVETPALDVLMTHARGEAASAAGQAKLAAATAALARPLARIEAHLAGRAWLVGDRFTVADILLAEAVRYAQPHPPALAPFPAVQAWIARCQARPAFQAMMARRNAEPA